MANEEQVLKAIEILICYADIASRTTGAESVNMCHLSEIDRFLRHR